MVRKSLTAAAMAALILTPACADTAESTTMDKEAIEEIVRNYILENPEIIEEALIQLAENERAEAERAQIAAVAANKEALYSNPTDYSIGPADAEVTIVEFFDYRCGYCKRSADWIQDLPEDYDGKVRVVFKELPILSAESEQAALAALAAGKQGKYNEMHLALMELASNTGFKPANIDAVAEDVGVNVQKMRADMRSAEIQKQLSDMKQLGRDLEVGGTPTFFIGDRPVPNGANRDALNEMIEAELAS